MHQEALESITPRLSRGICSLVEDDLINGLESQLMSTGKVHLPGAVCLALDIPD